MYRPVHDSRVMAFLEHGNVQKGESIGLTTVDRGELGVGPR